MVWKHSEKEKGQTSSFLGSEQCDLVKGTVDVCGKGTAVTQVTLKTIYNLESGEDLSGSCTGLFLNLHSYKFIPQPGE